MKVSWCVCGGLQQAPSLANDSWHHANVCVCKLQVLNTDSRWSTQVINRCKLWWRWRFTNNNKQKTGLDRELPKHSSCLWNIWRESQRSSLNTQDYVSGERCQCRLNEWNMVSFHSKSFSYFHRKWVFREIKMFPMFTSPRSLACLWSQSDPAH